MIMEFSDTVCYNGGGEGPMRSVARLCCVRTHLLVTGLTHEQLRRHRVCMHR